MSRLVSVIAGWISRFVVIGSTFVNTRLLIELVGIDNYAAYSILLSLAPWLALLNLGVPNAAQNLIVKRYVAGRQTQRIQDVAAGTACIAGLAYFPLALLLAWLVNRYLLTDYSAQSVWSVAVLLWALVMQGLTNIFHQILHALHRSVWPSIAPAVQAGLSTLLLLAACVFSYAGSTIVTLAISVPMMLVFLISAVLVGARPVWRVKWRALKYLLYRAQGFLFFGVMGALTLSCDYVVMSQLLQSTEVTQYNLVAKTLGTVLTLHGVLLATNWSFLSDCFYRKDFAGVRRLLVKLLGLGFVLLIIVGCPLALMMDNVGVLLTGGKVATIPLATTLCWLLYVAVRIWSDTFATALLSFNYVGFMNRYVIWQSLFSLVAQWILGSYLGAVGIVLGITLSFLLTAAWVLPLHFHMAINFNKNSVS